LKSRSVSNPNILVDDSVNNEPKPETKKKLKEDITATRKSSDKDENKKEYESSTTIDSLDL